MAMAVFEPSLRRVARCVRWILEEETTLGCNEGVIECQRVAVAEEALQPCQEKVTLECWIDCGYDLGCGHHCYQEAHDCLVSIDAQRQQ